MLEKLKKEVLDANLMIPEEHLAILTWGNVSGITEDRKHVVIKASGVPYDTMNTAHMVVTDIDGHTDSKYNPSTDLATHLEIYKAFPSAMAVVHAHSQFATIWAQAGRGIPCLGTTHADYFYGTIPCTRKMTPAEIENDYELNTGKVIVETFKDLNPKTMQAVLVHSHGPFVWGKSPIDAVKNAMILEYIAKMASFDALMEGNNLQTIQPELLEKHYMRKFGANAYYGQK